jgi:hypothetical protein
MAALDHTTILGEAKGSASRTEVAGGSKTWFQSTNAASASDVAVPETLEKRAEAPTPVAVNSRLQSGAILGVFYCPLCAYSSWFMCRAHWGSLIVVVAAVGGLAGKRLACETRLRAG